MRPAQRRLVPAWTGELRFTYEHDELAPSAPIGKPAVIVQRALRASGTIIDPGQGLHTVQRAVARAFFDHSVARGYDAALLKRVRCCPPGSTQDTEQYRGLSSEKLHRDVVLRGRRSNGDG
ncbi:hypothetical protein GCM10009606_11550 [Nocardioides aquiterrae]|uniref:Uncharacterized protein n=1 Tax=Nocardioides aquiterrae TaxID=203799 RepID=A0ABP4EZ60_9ACTN